MKSKEIKVALHNYQIVHLKPTIEGEIEDIPASKKLKRVTNFLS